MSRPMRTLREVYPLGSTLLLVVGWLFIEAAVQVGLWSGGWNAFTATWNRWIFLTCLLLGMALIVGLIRAAVFHPGYNSGYRAWLAQVGWSGDRPLPFGPVRLTWGDAIFPALLALLMAINRVPEVSAVPVPFPPLLPPVVFLAAYNLILWHKLASARARLACLALLPLMVFPLPSLIAALTVQLVIYGVLAVALGRELRRFPWQEPDWTRSIQEQHLAEALSRGLIGWPYHVLGPRTVFPSISWGWAAAWSGLAAWWTLALVLAIPLPALHADVAAAFGAAHPMDPHALWVVAYLGVAAVRLMRYNPLKYQPSPGPVARLATGRLIVPGYDRVFIAPLLVIGFGWLGPAALATLGLPAALIPALAVFGVVVLTLSVGPSLEAWHYTGNHRLWRAACEPAVQKSQSQSQLNEVRINFGRL